MKPKEYFSIEIISVTNKILCDVKQKNNDKKDEQSHLSTVSNNIAMNLVNKNFFKKNKIKDKIDQLTNLFIIKCAYIT